MQITQFFYTTSRRLSFTLKRALQACSVLQDYHKEKDKLVMVCNPLFHSRTTIALCYGRFFLAKVCLNAEATIQHTIKKDIDR
jgi:hypothetical protein